MRQHYPDCDIISLHGDFFFRVASDHVEEICLHRLLTYLAVNVGRTTSQRDVKGDYYFRSQTTMPWNVVTLWSQQSIGWRVCWIL